LSRQGIEPRSKGLLATLHLIGGIQEYFSHKVPPFSRTNFFGQNATAGVAPCQAGHSRRKTARRPSGHDNENTVKCRKLRIQRLVSRRLGGLVAERNHAHAGAFAAIDPRPEFAQGPADFLEETLTQIVLGPAVLRKGLRVLGADDE